MQSHLISIIYLVIYESGCIQSLCSIYNYYIGYWLIATANFVILSLCSSN